MMFYIAVVTFVILTCGLLIEHWASEGPLRILNYSKEQYVWGYSVGCLQLFVLYFKIMAY